MLNLDLSQFNPVQSDSQYCTPPMPSAHLVTIENVELKESNKDGFSKGTNLVLELTILASSVGNEYIGQKMPIFIPYSGYSDDVINIGLQKLSTIAHTIGLGGYIQNKEDLYGSNFIVVLEKQKNSNFPNFRRVLNAEGLELANRQGEFRVCTLNDKVLVSELEKLLASMNGSTQQAQAPSFATQQAQAPQQAPSFATQQAQAPSFATQQAQAPQQAPSFAPTWGQTVNTNNA